MKNQETKQIPNSVKNQIGENYELLKFEKRTSYNHYILRTEDGVMFFHTSLSGNLISSGQASYTETLQDFNDRKGISTLTFKVIK